MGKRSTRENKNEYQLAREAQNLTREAASELIQYVSDDRIEKIEEIFKLAMKRAKTLFGTHAFRKSYGTKHRTPINKALFELWCSILAAMDENDFNKLRYSSQFMTDYNALLDDDKFNVYISRDSWKPTSVRNRYVIINDMIKKYTI